MIKLKELLNEATPSLRSISKWNKLADSSTGRKNLPMLLIRGRWYAWEEGDRNSVFVSDKSGKEHEFDYSDVEQIEESVNEGPTSNDLMKELEKVNKITIKILKKYEKSIGNYMPAVIQKWMMGLHSDIKKQGYRV